MTSYFQVRTRILALALLAGSIQLAIAQALPQQAGDFITLKAELALGYELKAVERRPPTDANDPRDAGADILYLHTPPNYLRD
jgi:hypothetical protein